MTSPRSLLLSALSGVLAAGLCGASALADEQPLETLNSWNYAYNDATSDWADYEGWTVEGAATYYGLDDDEGRFRQDRFIDDDVTGGIEYLTYKDESLDVTIRAIVEDLYGVSAHYVKPEQFRLDLDFSRHRKYFDGSNEAWDPTRYLLPASFADPADDNMYIDWTNIDLSGTLLMPELPHVTLGWSHMERVGDEVLLRGGRARYDALPTNQRQASIPVTNDVDWRSDTVYVEVPFTLQEQYNFKIRQEYETLRGDETSLEPRYNAGVLGYNEFRHDDLDWEEWRTLVSFDSFLADGIFMSANFYHTDLDNDSHRNVNQVTAGGVDPQFVGSDIATDRRSNVFTVGMVFLNLAEDLQLNTSLRLERTKIGGDLSTLEDGLAPPITANNDEEENRLGESAKLVWKGVPNTTVTAEGEWEQRYWDVEWVEDGAVTRDADVDSNRQRYTLTLVNRFRPDLRLTSRYRYMHNEDDRDAPFDPDPGNYPDFLGDQDQDVHEITLKADWHFLPAWTTSLKYQFENDQRDTNIQTSDGQDLDVHRISGTVFGSPCANLTLTGMGTFEDYQLDTPVVGPGTNSWAPGTRTYDYEYEAYILMGGANYVINDRWTANLSYQHTELIGDVDNGLDEVWLGADYMLAEGRIIKARYEYFNFEDDLGNGFDDYDGHGIYVALAYRF